MRSSTSRAWYSLFVALCLSLTACERTEPRDPTLAKKAGEPAQHQVEGPAPPDWHDPKSPIKADEVVALFPAGAFLNEAGDTYEVELRGWIYEPEAGDLKRTALVKAIEEAVGVDDDTPSGALFEGRVRALLVDGESGKKVPLAIGDHNVTSAPSSKGGYFSATLTVPREEFDALEAAPGGVVAHALTRPGDAREFTGLVQSIPAEGLTVISDVDDTVRDSRVTDKKELLRRALLLPYELVPKMAERYRGWLHKPEDRLHFVSASPWQLYPGLAALFAEGGFPPARYGLRTLPEQLKDINELFSASGDVKRAAVLETVAKSPGRKFVLVGDSGEGDPEMYADVTRQYPDRVVAIFIREAEGGRNDEARFLDAFEGLPRGLWATFKTGDDLPASLDDRRAGAP